MKIFYGIDALPHDGAGFLPGGHQLAVTIEPSARTPLRLNSGSLAWGERAALAVYADTPYEAMHRQLASACGSWSVLPRRFLAWYFGEIDRVLDDHRCEIEAALGPCQGLYTYRDWRFSALKPLPRAHLQVSAGEHVRVEHAFWTGARLVAFESGGSAATPKSRARARSLLQVAGVEVVAYAEADLIPGNRAFLEACLGLESMMFWHSAPLPTGPWPPDLLEP